MQFFIFFFSVAIFVSCSAIDVSEQTPLTGMSVEESWLWIDKNIDFRSDFIDDFQLPETTYRLRTGDCEDFCILLMSVMNAHGSAPELICIEKNNQWHYIVKWRDNYYEPQIYYKQYSKVFVQDRFLWSFSYEEALLMAH